jgi:hypothetical protein
VEVDDAVMLDASGREVRPQHHDWGYPMRRAVLEAVGRAQILRAARHELLKGAPSGHLAISLAAAIAVLLAWTLLALGLGARRTITRDA